MKLLILASMLALVSCGKNEPIDCFNGCTSGGSGSGASVPKEATLVTFDVCDEKASVVKTLANTIEVRFNHETNDDVGQSRTVLESRSSVKCGQPLENYAVEDRLGWVMTCNRLNDDFSQGVGNFVTPSGCVVRVNHDTDNKTVRVQETEARTDKPRKPKQPLVVLDEQTYHY